MSADNAVRDPVAAVLRVAGQHGIRVTKPVVLHDLFSMVVHLAPAPVVARVPTAVARLRPPTPERLGRELAVAQFLADHGLPVVTPSAEVPPGPHFMDGYAITFWTYVEPDPAREVSNADCLAMLGDLHAGLRAYPGDLPDLADLAIDRQWLQLMDNAGPILDDADRAAIHAAADRIIPALRATADKQPLHGDVHPGNIIASRSGLLWTDFEEVCRGPLEWDLASIGPTAEPLPRHDRDLLEVCAQARTLQVAVCLIAIRDVTGSDWDDAIHELLQQIR